VTLCNKILTRFKEITPLIHSVIARSSTD